MANRAQDWLAQAEHDLQHARSSRACGDHDWACFAAHQAAEKAVKALVMSFGGEGWGHSITYLLADMEAFVHVPEDAKGAARRLDRHYVPARYPNGFDRGTPSEYYGPEDAGQAIADAETVHRFCRDAIREPGRGA